MRKHRGILAVMAALSLFSCAAWAEDGGTKDIPSLRAQAESGDADAQYQLGEAYQKGEGVRQDDVQAIKWFQASANQADADAQTALGFAYRGGFGVPKDEVLAYMWFDLAAQQGNEEASDMRFAVAELMTYDQISDARKKSKEWKPAKPVAVR